MGMWNSHPTNSNPYVKVLQQDGRMGWSRLKPVKIGLELVCQEALREDVSKVKEDKKGYINKTMPGEVRWIQRYSAPLWEGGSSRPIPIQAWSDTKWYSTSDVRYSHQKWKIRCQVLLFGDRRVPVARNRTTDSWNGVPGPIENDKIGEDKSRWET